MDYKIHYSEYVVKPEVRLLHKKIQIVFKLVMRELKLTHYYCSIIS